MAGGGSSQMITVLRRCVPENDYSVRRILGYYIRNIISIDLTKNSGSLFKLIKSNFLGGM